MPKQIQISSLAKLKSIQQTLAAMFAVGGASRFSLKDSLAKSCLSLSLCRSLRLKIAEIR